MAVHRYNVLTGNLCGSRGGYNTLRLREVTCLRCLAAILRYESQFVSNSREIRRVFGRITSVRSERGLA